MHSFTTILPSVAPAFATPMFNALPFAPTVGLVLFGVVAAAAINDLQSRRIPNELIAVALCLALVLQCAIHGGFAGLGVWSSGLLTGAALFLPLYAVHGMGAGDVKLMAAVGALVGPGLALSIALAAGIVGAIWIFGIVCYRGQLTATLRRVTAVLRMMVSDPCAVTVPRDGAIGSSLGTVPYGLVIAIGTLWVITAWT